MVDRQLYRNDNSQVVNTFQRNAWCDRTERTDTRRVFPNL